jgi:Rad3-related DNA helicase
MFVSWSLDSHTQHAILSDNIVDLPLSMIQLDPPQERIARTPPPLLIESRSGTGKTLVLLQHAAFYHRTGDPRPACFITVSPRLRNELEQRYEELIPIHGAGLPKTKFFSFQDFIASILSHLSIGDFIEKDKATFQGFTVARRSHRKLDIEAHLLENEIGGVIMGSVVAAQQGKPLDRLQYQNDKRSNIPNKTQEGHTMRDLVFDEFERYKEWKSTCGKYDIHDAVLRLLRQKSQQLFSSGKHVRKMVRLC